MCLPTVHRPASTAMAMSAHGATALCIAASGHRDWANTGCITYEAQPRICSIAPLVKQWREQQQQQAIDSSRRPKCSPTDEADCYDCAGSLICLPMRLCRAPFMLLKSLMCHHTAKQPYIVHHLWRRCKPGTSFAGGPPNQARRLQKHWQRFVCFDGLQSNQYAGLLTH